MPVSEPTTEGRELVGFSRPYEAGGLQATVLYQRAMKAARSGRVSVEKLLGHIIAHEVGHLLLWSNAHSSRGLMKKEYSSDDFIAMANGHLTFTCQEAQIMNENVVRRRMQEKLLHHGNQ